MKPVTIFWRILPLLFCLSGFVLVHYYDEAYLSLDVLRTLPYVLALVLACFAIIFNRSRFLAPVISIILSYWFIRTQLQASLQNPETQLLFIQLNIALVFQLVTCALWREKGIFHLSGGLLFAVLLLCNLWLWQGQLPASLLAWMQASSWFYTPIHPSAYWFTQGLALLHLTGLLVITLCALLRKSAVEFGLMLCSISAIYVVYQFAQQEVSSIVFTALMLALFVAFQQNNFLVTYIDALTGIPGRRSLDEKLASLARTYTLAMLDVDHFKKFNDTHGHEVGDQVLKMVAGRIAQVQGGGVAYRYGGEEFCIVFNRRRVEDCFVFLEAVREAVASYQLVLRAEDREADRNQGKKQRGRKEAKPRSVSVTISIGLANSEPGLSPQEVLKRADENLYKAKQGGRNMTFKPTSEPVANKRRSSQATSKAA